MQLTRAEDVGLCSRRLSRIDDWMDRWVGSGKLPGMSVAVMRKGRVAYFRAAGLRDVERGTPMTEDTVVRIYSMTKPLTSLAIMMLYEEGKFQLDDPISKVLPSFANQRVFSGGSKLERETVPAERDITYRDLLTHTSGLAFGFMETHIVDTIYNAKGIDFVFDQRPPPRTRRPWPR
jgi:CubicO group peptidase (beta-lactamase class C family)